MVEGSNRATNACENCRRRKVKCSGSQPCRGCLRHNVSCTYGNSGRKRFSESYVHGLLQRIQSYENASSQNAPDKLPPRSVAISAQGLQVRDTSGIATIGHDEFGNSVNSTDRHYDALPKVDGTPLRLLDQEQGAQLSTQLTGSGQKASPASDFGSGPAFEKQVRSLLEQNVPWSEPPQQDCVDRVERIDKRAAEDDGHEDNSNPLQWQSMDELIEDQESFKLPSEAESRRLFNLFMLYLGSNQHFLDSRSFSDSLTLLYRTSATRQKLQSSEWFTLYLSVMAMAKLMDSYDEPLRRHPGSDCFAQAIARLPYMHQLGDRGVIAVEILAVVALYLQWCDKKHDAYLYIGIAIRLATALGCFRLVDEQDCLPSEATHRLRLWWTVFMLDRRLSAGLGLPFGADERQIRSNLPEAAAGFPSHIPLVINIKIARITGDIMSSLYGNTAITELQLVHKIQDILQTLHDLGRTIPVEYAIDFSQQPLQVTRTGASLYLMLFQAIILCVRPIVLQAVRHKVQAPRDNDNNQTQPPVIRRLCQTCDEAAKKCIHMLRALQHKGHITCFGFFDLDSMFAAAFILVMLCFLNGRQVNSRPPREIKMAIEFLQHLSVAGNRAATQRLNDIAQFCSNVWPDRSVSDPLKNLHSISTSSNQAKGKGKDISVQIPLKPLAPRPERTIENIQDTTEVPQDHSSVPSSSSGGPGEQLANWPNGGVTQFDFDNITNELVPEADEIYSSFYDPNFPLTGIDYVDWAEMEKFFAEQNM